VDKKLEPLSKLLQEMLENGVELTARGVVARSEGLFKNASDITRVQERRSLLESLQARQAIVSAHAEKWNPQSKAKLVARLERSETELAEAKEDLALMTAAVRAMIHSIGESGGMAAWRRHFPAYKSAYARLRELGALPSAEVVELKRD
jgi:hypothetical protein